MQQQPITKNNNQDSTDIFTRTGLHEGERNIMNLTNTAWCIAYAALWNGAKFTTKEVSTAKEVINQFISSEGNSTCGYYEFVQRVLLARYYTTATHYLPAPGAWLSEECANGFASTKSQYNHLLLERLLHPGYKDALRAFAAAALCLYNNFNGRNFHDQRSHFIVLEEQGLLNLLLSTVAAMQSNR